MEKIYLAAGCYWGVEKYLSQHKGVISTSVGFMGGDNQYSLYEQVVTGLTGHAETVEVIFDNSETSLREIILYFFRIHDPTTLNRQKNDVGTHYRSTIFYNNDSDKRSIELLIKAIDESGYFKNKIVTTLEPESIYYKASENHQNYLAKNPNGYNCHLLGPSINI